MARTVSFGAALSQGSWPVQEDGFLADPSRKVFAVADGFGGRGAGDMAAKLALDTLRAPPVTTGAPSPGESPALALGRSMLSLANKQILDRNAGRPAGSRGGASLAVALFRPGRVISLVHTGSCAALLWRGGTLFPLLTPQAAPRREFQALLPDQALGLGEDLHVEAREIVLQPEDILFLVSGGLDWETDGFRAQLAAELALRVPGSSLEPVARSLIEQASLSAQGWNRTLLAVELP